MVLDTSVLVAILLQEAGYERLATAIDSAPELLLGRQLFWKPEWSSHHACNRMPDR